mmetsp:Transcript_4799/g.13601  ORF Transcript_4799/g.13601 Transcript_4799/m.13601 type:complete len:205 (-) Transcript_4799:539-1153(-)
MTTARGEEDDISVVKDRGDHGDVREVRSSRELGVVRYQDLALLDALPSLLVPVIHLKLDGRLHRPQMNGDVRGVRHESPVPGEEGAGKIETFFHVDRYGRPRQRTSHLFGDSHESMRKDGELDRILLHFFHRLLARVVIIVVEALNVVVDVIPGFVTDSNVNVSVGRHDGGAPDLEKDSADGLDDDRGSDHGVSGFQVLRCRSK